MPPPAEKTNVAQKPGPEEANAVGITGDTGKGQNLIISLKDFWKCQVYVNRPNPTLEDFDFERDSQGGGLYLLLLTWM